ncbi:SCP2 sterol-binding domain-containing protein [Desulfallas sp. Bu1-1]|jgi:putative sterol carrier protein|uniref:SCP2 sterol-binding domain-containing protein n=1 Tax=Desulfallas sp. Bu1-1 TaxID=2787620 RepID=UPI00189DDD6F|nr:SCP2 sterol-binding domain-containing protein [Desulfallas sp. Bu1-1]MBF7081828.1 SCP2 sterol-binding domain-containing protein [Desulfallas sp. Bu1-1]
MSMKEIFSKIQERLDADPSKAAGLTATYQFSLSGDDGGEYYIVFANGAGKVNEGVADNSDITILMAASDFKDLVEGKLDGMGAFMSGKLKVQGDLSLAMRLQTLLG